MSAASDRESIASSQPNGHGGKRKAVVVGGGIGGATTALILGRQGWDVLLVERLPTWSVLGSGISLIYPAVRALDRIGVLPDCIEDGCVMDLVRICGADSVPFQDVVMSPPNDERLPGLLGMMRPKLHEIISTAALDEGLRVKLGTTVTAIHDDGGGVDVETSDGETERFDLLVAADGLHGTTRNLLFEGLPEPTFRGQSIYRAVVRKPAHVNVHYQFQGEGMTADSGITPTGPDHGYVFCLLHADDQTRPATEDWPRLMRGHLSHLTGLGAELRDAIEGPETIDFRTLETFMLPKPWNKGHAIVLGDAAHSTTPQLGAGGAMCLEDAIALGEELDRVDSISEALHNFTERRFERCRFIVDASIKLSDDQMYDDTEIHHELFPQAMALLAEEF